MPLLSDRATDPLRPGGPRAASRRRFFQIASRVALLAAVPLAGCANNPPSPTDSGASGAASPAAASSAAASGASSGPKNAADVKAGLVTDVGGINDQSFNASAWHGLQRAGKDLGIQIKYTESRQNADYVANLTRFAQAGYDVVFAVGFKMQDALAEVAPRYPNVEFAIIDGDAPNLPNCASYKFREEQGSYLVGALAGAMTKTGKVGFVGGEQMPLIAKFEVGYKAGVETTNPKATVLVGYAQAFNDPQKGEELALSQFGAGADIVYHAAGSSGLGVIKAAENKGPGFYAIGVDQDQDGIAPGRVLTSMVKRVDVAVFTVCQSVVKGTFHPGTTTLGLQEDGVGMSPMRFTKKDVPPAVLAKIKALKGEIIAGKVVPPTTAAELAAFKPPAS
jgi:basic membrane protein A